MPRLPWHLHKRQHDSNTKTLLASKSPTFTDWEVITLFYSVMHHVDACFSSLRASGARIPEPHNHKERRRLVKSFLRPISSDYRMLDKISQWARYHEVNITPTILGTAMSLHSNITSHLRTIVP